MKNGNYEYKMCTNLLVRVYILEIIYIKGGGTMRLKRVCKKVMAIGLSVAILGAGCSTRVFADVGGTVVETIEEGSSELKVVKELTERRTENSNAYLLSDGSIRVDVCSEAIRYEEKGELIDYDTSLGELDKKEQKNLDTLLESKESDKYIAVNAQGDTKQYFPERLDGENAIVMENDKCMFSFTPVTNYGESTSYTSKVDGDNITYSSSNGKITYEYKSLKNGVKEDIVLNSKPKSNKFVFDLELKGVTLELEKSDGSISLKDTKTKKEVGYLMAPNIVDADGNVDYANIKYQLTENKEGVSLNLIIDKGYLENEKLKYPITVDPTMIWADDKLSTAVVSSMSSEKNLTLHPTELTVENQCRTESAYIGTERRVYVDTSKIVTGDFKMGGDSQMDNTYLKYAVLCAYEYDSDFSPCTVEVRKPKASWNVNKITWNNQPQLGDKIAEFKCNGVNKTQHSSYVTEWADNIFNKKETDTGLVFVAKEKGTGASLRGSEYRDGGYLWIMLTFAHAMNLQEHNFTTQKTTDYTYLGTEQTFNSIIPAYKPANLSTIGGLTNPAIISGTNLTEVDPSIFPNSAVVHIRVPMGNTGKVALGSGFLVGPNTIITAAHCVWLQEFEEWQNEIRVYPQFKNNLSITYYKAESVICQKDYIDKKDIRWQYDWAIITLKEDIGAKYGWLGVGFGSNLIDKPVTLAGYPTGDDGRRVQYQSKGVIEKGGTNIPPELVYWSTTNRKSGISGGPIFDDNAVSWGIHTSSRGVKSQGILYNPCLYELIKSRVEEGKLKYNYN